MFPNYIGTCIASMDLKLSLMVYLGDLYGSKNALCEDEGKNKT